MSLTVQIKSNSGPSTMPIDALLLSERKIFLEDSITMKTASDLEKAVLYLGQKDPYEPITLILNTPGGEVMAGLLIYDIMQTSGLRFETFCTGCCYSFGAILLSAGNSGRYILPDSKVMIHEPQLFGSLGGSSTSVRTISDSLLETKKKLNEILCRHSKMTMEEVEEMTSYDHFLSPGEAVSLGLCDEVVGFGRLFGQKED